MGMERHSGGSPGWSVEVEVGRRQLWKLLVNFDVSTRQGPFWQGCEGLCWETGSGSPGALQPGRTHFGNEKPLPKAGLEARCWVQEQVHVALCRLLAAPKL